MKSEETDWQDDPPDPDMVDINCADCGAGGRIPKGYVDKERYPKFWCWPCNTKRLMGNHFKDEHNI